MVHGGLLYRGHTGIYVSTETFFLSTSVKRDKISVVKVGEECDCIWFNAHGG